MHFGGGRGWRGRGGEHEIGYYRFLCIYTHKKYGWYLIDIHILYFGSDENKTKKKKKKEKKKKEKKKGSLVQSVARVGRVRIPAWLRNFRGDWSWNGS